MDNLILVGKIAGTCFIIMGAAYLLDKTRWPHTGRLGDYAFGIFASLMFFGTLWTLIDSQFMFEVHIPWVYLLFWVIVWGVLAFLCLWPTTAPFVTRRVLTFIRHLFRWGRDNAPPACWAGVGALSLCMLILFQFTQPGTGSVTYLNDHWWFWYRVLVLSMPCVVVSFIITRIDDAKDFFSYAFKAKAKKVLGDFTEEEAATTPAPRMERGPGYWALHTFSNLAADLAENLVTREFWERFLKRAK
jgi:hypothetical protein